MRELTGMQPITMYEFKGKTLGAVLGELTPWVATQEAEGATMTIHQEWNEEDGYLIYVYVSY